MLAFPLNTQADSDVSAAGRADRRAGRRASAPSTATVTLTPRDAADKANWLTITVLAGRRAAHRRPPASASRRASTARRSRCPSTASGRRWSACTRATRSPACRSTRRRTGRSRPRRVAAPGELHARRSTPTGSCCSARLKTAERPRSRTPPTAPCSCSRCGLLAMLAWGAAPRRHDRRPQARRGAARLARATPDADASDRTAPDAATRPAHGSSGHEELPDWARPTARSRDRRLRRRAMSVLEVRLRRARRRRRRRAATSRTCASRSSAPASPASASRSASRSRASRTSSSSSAPTTSAAPGRPTPTRAASATSPRTCTRSRSRRTPTGRAPTRASRRSGTTCATSPTQHDLHPHIRFGHELTARGLGRRRASAGASRRRAARGRRSCSSTRPAR